MIAGVSAGLAQHFGLDPVIVRLLFVLLFFAPHSPALLIYIILWVVMPQEPAPTPRPARCLVFWQADQVVMPQEPAPTPRYDAYTGQPLS
jgi:phage shock protein C